PGSGWTVRYLSMTRLSMARWCHEANRGPSPGKTLRLTGLSRTEKLIASIRVAPIQRDGRRLTGEPGEQGHVLWMVLSPVRGDMEREFRVRLNNITDFEQVGKARARLRFYPSGYDVPNQGVRVPFGEFMTQSGYVFNRCLKDMRIAVAAPDVGVDVLTVTKAGG